MLYTDEKQIEQHDPRVANNIGLVTSTIGQKFGYVMMMFFLGILTIGMFPVVYINTSKNKINRLQIKINESASGIDVQLEQRFDLLTKLVDAVKSHVRFNTEIFESIAALRSGKSSNTDIVSKFENIDRVNRNINIALEAYPDLGADRSVYKLMNESSVIERELASTRRLYNALVTEFNQMIFSFPVSVIATKMKCQAIKLFAASEEKRKDVKISF